MYTYKRLTLQELEERLRPLIDRFDACDRLRVRLETEGGLHADLEDYTEALLTTDTMTGRYRSYEVCPASPVEAQRYLDDISSYRVHLQTRARANTLPVWCLCRARRDYWDAHRLVVQTYYRSPGYPSRDDRFISIMSNGRETPHINLGPYRAQAAALVERYGYHSYDYDYGFYDDASPDTLDDRVDQLLLDVGRHVFSAAWHDDQEAAVLVARTFDIPSLEPAIEVLYLCLGGSLAELRGAMSDTLTRFFVDVYPSPALHRMLDLLWDLDGPTLNELTEDQAPRAYMELMRAYRRFLHAPTTRSGRRRVVPLRKALFSNLSRLPLVAAELGEQEPVREAAAELETQARRVIETIAA